MFGFSPLSMMCGMPGMYGMPFGNGMYGNSGNVHQYFKNMYHINHEDTDTRPYVRSYPIAYKPDPVSNTSKKSFWA